jgi:hypothetical protein
MKWIILLVLPFDFALLYRAVRILLEILYARKRKQTTIRGRSISVVAGELLITLIVVGCGIWAVWFVLANF